MRAAKGKDFEECIKLVGEKQVDLAALITHAMPYTQLNEALIMLMEPSGERLKVIMEMS